MKISWKSFLEEQNPIMIVEKMEKGRLSPELRKVINNLEEANEELKHGGERDSLYYGLAKQIQIYHDALDDKEKVAKRKIQFEKLISSMLNICFNENTFYESDIDIAFDLLSRFNSFQKNSMFGSYFFRNKVGDSIVKIVSDSSVDRLKDNIKEWMEDIQKKYENYINDLKAERSMTKEEKEKIEKEYVEEYIRFSIREWLTSDLAKNDMLYEMMIFLKDGTNLNCSELDITNYNNKIKVKDENNQSIKKNEALKYMLFEKQNSFFARIPLILNSDLWNRNLMSISDYGINFTEVHTDIDVKDIFDLEIFSDLTKTEINAYVYIYEKMESEKLQPYGNPVGVKKIVGGEIVDNHIDVEQEKKLKKIQDDYMLCVELSKDFPFYSQIPIFYCLVEFLDYEIKKSVHSKKKWKVDETFAAVFSYINQKKLSMIYRQEKQMFYYLFVHYVGYDSNVYADLCEYVEKTCDIPKMKSKCDIEKVQYGESRKITNLQKKMQFEYLKSYIIE